MYCIWLLSSALTHFSACAFISLFNCLLLLSISSFSLSLLFDTSSCLRKKSETGPWSILMLPAEAALFYSDRTVFKQRHCCSDPSVLSICSWPRIYRISFLVGGAITLQASPLLPSFALRPILIAFVATAAKLTENCQPIMMQNMWTHLKFYCMIGLLTFFVSSIL